MDLWEEGEDNASPIVKATGATLNLAMLQTFYCPASLQHTKTGGGGPTVSAMGMHSPTSLANTFVPPCSTLRQITERAVLFVNTVTHCEKHLPLS